MECPPAEPAVVEAAYMPHADVLNWPPRHPCCLTIPEAEHKISDGPCNICKHAAAWPGLTDEQYLSWLKLYHQHKRTMAEIRRRLGVAPIA